MQKPKLIRNVVVVGALHHGKTTLCDMVIESTFKTNPNNKESRKYTDLRVDEIDRSISIKANPFQVLLEDTRDKNYVFNVIDTPGHPNFSDQVSVGLRMADSVLLVVDVVDGMSLYLEKLI